MLLPFVELIGSPLCSFLPNVVIKYRKHNKHSPLISFPDWKESVDLRACASRVSYRFYDVN
jgi:hypothetical protein